MLIWASQRSFDVVNTFAELVARERLICAGCLAVLAHGSGCPERGLGVEYLAVRGNGGLRKS
jgi:hypothetical protein